MRYSSGKHITFMRAPYAVHSLTHDTEQATVSPSLVHIDYTLWAKKNTLHVKWAVVSCSLQGNRVFEVFMWTSGDLDCTILRFHIAAYRQQCRAEEKGGWFSSITPRIMRQHGSGCAAMATVFHWPTDGAALCVSVIAAERMNMWRMCMRASTACVCVCVFEMDGGKRRQRKWERERLTGVRMTC